MTASKTNDTSGDKPDDQDPRDVFDHFNYSDDRGYGATAAKPSLANFTTPHLGTVELDYSPTVTYVDGTKDSVALSIDTTDGSASIGILALLTPEQADEIADRLHHAAGEVREHTKLEEDTDV